MRRTRPPLGAIEMPQSPVRGARRTPRMIRAADPLGRVSAPKRCSGSQRQIADESCCTAWRRSALWVRTGSMRGRGGGGKGRVRKTETYVPKRFKDPERRVVLKTTDPQPKSLYRGPCPCTPVHIRTPLSVRPSIDPSARTSQTSNATPNDQNPTRRPPDRPPEPSSAGLPRRIMFFSSYFCALHQIFILNRARAAALCIA